VVILGILAAIVIPQFTEASTEAKTSALLSDLQGVRSQIELYKIQHNDIMPGDTDLDGVVDDAGEYGSGFDHEKPIRLALPCWYRLRSLSAEVPHQSVHNR
jgi:type II secretory pathway pseudopilin PulG